MQCTRPDNIPPQDYITQQWVHYHSLLRARVNVMNMSPQSAMHTPWQDISHNNGCIIIFFYSLLLVFKPLAPKISPHTPQKPHHEPIKNQTYSHLKTHINVPSTVTATLKSLPADIATDRRDGSGGVAALYVLSPQHTIRPPFVTAQLWSYPAATVLQTPICIVMLHSTPNQPVSH